ncbi:MAG: hypothetical protein IJ011_03555 [Clostridia bacterium]|nr:hypothetical protein [Clostridia bacterium]
MKKLISLGLSLLMVLVFVCSALPVYATEAGNASVLSDADKAAVEAGTPFRLGDAYYASFEAALEAAEADSTVYLLADATTSSVATISVNKNITLKGIGDVTITNTATSNKYWLNSVTANLTIEDITLDIGCGGIVVGNNGNINMTNVTAVAKARPLLKLSNTEGTSTATITDSELSFEGTSQKQSVVTLEKAGKHVLNLEGNTTLTRTSACDTWGANDHVSYNNSVICIFYANGESTVNVGSNVKIIGKHGAASTNAKNDIPSLLVYMNDNSSSAGKLTVNLAAGSELAFDRINDGKNKNTYFNLLGDTSNVTINDLGCKYTANADALTAGVVLPTVITNGEGGALLGYKMGETAIEGNEYTNAEATAAATFTATFAEPIPEEPEPEVPTNPELSDEDNAAVAAGTPFRLNDTYYATFEAALEAAEADSTIYMLADVSTATQSIAIAKNITLKGVGDVTLTHTASNNSYWISSVTATLTIEDMNFVIGCGGITVSDNGNINMTSVNADAKRRPMLKVSNKTGTSTATITDSNISFTGTAQLQNCIILEQTGNHVLNLVGKTTVSRTSALADWNAYNDGVIAVWYSIGEGKSTINLGENATILAQHGAENVKVANIPSCIVYCNDGLAGGVGAGTLELNLAKGSKMEFDRINDGENKNVFINLMGDTKNVTVNDSGCIYKANKDSLVAGVVLPTCVSDGKGGAALGFNVNGDGVTFAEEYVKADATEAAEFTAFFFDADGFKLIDGASIRLEKPYGIRFSVEVSAELYTTLKALDPNVEFGMILAPTRKVFDGFKPDEMADRDKAVIKCENWAVENVNGIYGYNGAIYISDDQLLKTADEATFEAKISALAYVTFTVNGETRTIYTTYDETVNSRSILDVAQSYYNDTVNGSTENAIINYIIATCDDTEA